jgi:hypothetical protein
MVINVRGLDEFDFYLMEKECSSAERPMTKRGSECLAALGIEVST